MAGRGGDLTFSDAERAVDVLLGESYLAAQHELPGLVAAGAAVLEAADALVYLVDLQQQALVPFGGEHRPGTADVVAALSVDGSLAGRSFQQGEVLTQAGEDDGVRVWLPLLSGAERLGVLAVTVERAREHDLGSSQFGSRLQRFAALVAEIVMTKTSYGDTIVRLRRRSAMGLAAELQWSLLPPLTFASSDVTVAGALEPAYRVAGDSLDYAVDRGVARLAVFDGMGHGLRSSQLASVAIAGYRNGRRSGLTLLDMAAGIHDALIEAFGGGAFTTGLLADLDTDTGLLSWISAGHPEPLLFREGRFIKALSSSTAQPLGMQLPQDVARRPFTICREQLEPGDRVLLYTDGVTDARSPDGDFFGDQRLTDLLTRNYADALSAPETLRRVVRSLLEHQQGQLTDDATLLLMQWRGATHTLPT